MDSVFVLGPDIQDTDIQAQVKKKRIFFQKNQVFLAEKRGVILDDENLIGPKKAHTLAICLEEEWFLYLSSVLRNMSYK